MLITFEGEVPQSSDASQNDHKSKGYPSKTSEAAFTMQKADKGALKKNSDCPALTYIFLGEMSMYKRAFE